MSGLSLTTILVLASLGLVGGIGITAVGPGGVVPTLGLFALTTLPPATIAGTAIVTHVATGILGTAVYVRSGQLRDPETRRTAAVLAAAALVATSLGVLINTAVSKRAFGIILGAFAISAAALLWRRGQSSAVIRRGGTHPHLLVVAAIGVTVAVASGIAGIGGPMLCVPVLVVCHVPVLEALAAAQVQSIVIAGVGTLAYAANGSIDWPLAALVGAPELVGVLLGWRIARAAPSHLLRGALIVTLLAVAPYLILNG